MPPALDALRDRLAELADLTALKRLAAWDQRTMMPPNGAAVDDLQRDLVRFARRDWERARQVPPELAAELALAAAEGQAVWQAARAAGDFAAFAPALRRNVELAREYAACFDGVEHPYDALLADFDFGLTATRVREIFEPLTETLSALAAEAAQRPPAPPLTVPIEAQHVAVERDRKSTRLNSSHTVIS